MASTVRREMLPGLHVEYDSDIPHKKVEAMIDPISKTPGLRELIARHPVGVLISRKGSNSTADGAHGSYRPSKTLAGMKMSPTIGLKYVDRRPSGFVHHTLSSKAKDVTEQMRTTLLHELGHHAHASTDRADYDAPTSPSFEEAKAKGQVSTYAGKNHREHFAENFVAMHTMSPEEHARRDPVGARAIREVADRHGFRPPSADEPGGGAWEESKHPRGEGGKFV